MLVNLIFCIFAMLLFGWGAILFINAFSICDNSARMHFAFSFGLLFVAFVLLIIFDPGVPMIEMFRMIAAGQ